MSKLLAPSLATGLKVRYPALANTRRETLRKENTAEQQAGVGGAARSEVAGMRREAQGEGKDDHGEDENGAEQHGFLFGFFHFHFVSPLAGIKTCVCYLLSGCRAGAQRCCAPTTPSDGSKSQ